ncbi:regucalcin-like [Achroia grisella]|uniref:regucalcin-like n=1 Tax=Achroia grisella TaxID=688607 RepID=UPI0027D2EB2B|nr:regucalcin-like [Achroia grisella]
MTVWIGLCWHGGEFGVLYIPTYKENIFVGTKGYQTHDDVLSDKATLYSIDQNNFRNPVVQLRPVSISNGLVWALNNSVMYYIDSLTMKVEAFDFDVQQGDISGRRTIIDISDYGYEDAIPDGMTIDDQGHLWVALMFGGTVLHVDPDTKEIIYSYKLPTSRVTSVAWGGPNLDELFITTGQDKVELNAEPLQGAIFTIRGTGRRGVPPNYFRFDNKQFKDISYNVFAYTNLTFTHAESPVWDSETNKLYWVDVLNQNVHELDYFTWRHNYKHIGYGEVNVVVPVMNSNRLLVGVRAELYLLDWSKSGDAAIRLLAALDQGKPDNVVNEGKADPMGRFWGGTKGPQRGDKVAHDEAALYSLEGPWYSARVKLKPVSISNGLVWSLNDTIMYYIDSTTRKIEAFDFEVRTGHISNRRTILNIRDYGYDKAIPDGMTIDADGLLWVALMFDGSIIRIDPDSRTIVEKYKLPVSRTTSVTWAGPQLDHLIVTTSRRNITPDELAREPLSGAIFILQQTGTRGVPAYKFVFENADLY